MAPTHLNANTDTFKKGVYQCITFYISITYILPVFHIIHYLYTFCTFWSTNTLKQKHIYMYISYSFHTSTFIHKVHIFTVIRKLPTKPFPLKGKYCMNGTGEHKQIEKHLLDYLNFHTRLKRRAQSTRIYRQRAQTTGKSICVYMRVYVMAYEKWWKYWSRLNTH